MCVGEKEKVIKHQHAILLLVTLAWSPPSQKKGVQGILHATYKYFILLLSKVFSVLCARFSAWIFAHWPDFH